MSTEEKKQIIEAIAAHLAGVATDADQRAIALWRAASKENEAFWGRITSDGKARQKLEEFRQADTRSAWYLMEKKLGPSRRDRLHLRYWPYAAAIACLLTAGILYTTVPSHPEQEPPLLSQPVQAPPPGPQLILADGTIVSIDQQEEQLIREEDGTTIYLESKHLDYTKGSIEQDSVALFNEIRMLNGMEYTMTLSDGTKVFLNAESHLRFPVKFPGDSRVVEFEGEAYFEVAKDHKRPFIIRTGGMELTVLGTEFNLRAYQDEASIETTLVEGSVQISCGANNCTLIPGEQAVVGRNSGEITSQKVDVDLYTAWRRSEIKFKDARLADVMRNLARWYGIEYEFMDPLSRELEFGGCFDRYESIDPILDMLRRTELVGVVKLNNKIYISLKK